MPRRKPLELDPVVTFSRDAVLDPAHIAAALRCSIEDVSAMDLPCFWHGARQKFIWGRVLDHLSAISDPDLTPDERTLHRRRRSA